MEPAGRRDRSPAMMGEPSADDRDALIARLERENAELIGRLARLARALHGLTEDLVRARREGAEWRRRYRAVAPAEEAAPGRRPSSPSLKRDAA